MGRVTEYWGGIMGAAAHKISFEEAKTVFYDSNALIIDAQSIRKRRTESNQYRDKILSRVIGAVIPFGVMASFHSREQ